MLEVQLMDPWARRQIIRPPPDAEQMPVRRTGICSQRIRRWGGTVSASVNFDFERLIAGWTYCEFRCLI